MKTQRVTDNPIETYEEYLVSSAFPAPDQNPKNKVLLSIEYF